MSPSNSVPRILQQRPGEPQQESPDSNEIQPKPQGQQDDQEIGEGSYEGTRDYNQRTKEYLKKADVQADAQAAKPRSEDEAREMKQAEDEGRSHSKGER